MIGKSGTGTGQVRAGKTSIFPSCQTFGYHRVYQLLWTLWFPICPYVCGYRSPTAIPNREEGVHKNKDPYGWYRNALIAPDFEIDQVLPHLFDKSIAYIKERANKNKPFFLYLPPCSAYSDCAVAPFKGMAR